MYPFCGLPFSSPFYDGHSHRYRPARAIQENRRRLASELEAEKALQRLRCLEQRHQRKLCERSRQEHQRRRILQIHMAEILQDEAMNEEGNEIQEPVGKGECVLLRANGSLCFVPVSSVQHCNSDDVERPDKNNTATAG